MRESTLSANRDLTVVLACLALDRGGDLRIFQFLLDQLFAFANCPVAAADPLRLRSVDLDRIASDGKARLFKVPGIS